MKKISAIKVDFAVLKPQQFIAPADLFEIKNSEHTFVNSREIFEENKHYLIFTGPAPFSRTDIEHAVLFEQYSKELLNYVDDIIAIYVQDAFVLEQFKNHVNTLTKTSCIKYWADGDAHWSQRNKMLKDFTGTGLSARIGRHVIITKGNRVLFSTCDDDGMIGNTHPDNIAYLFREYTLE